MKHAVSILLLALIVGLGGCAELAREKREKPEMLQRRERDRDAYLDEMDTVFTARMKQLKADDHEYKAGRRTDPPVLDVLIISGGGDYGAFGAGVLKGWAKVSKSDPLARPRFDIVTGVSTGALIAPFAFAGDEESIERVVQLYRNPRKDWVKQRGMLFFLPNNISFAEVPGLERDLRENVNLDLARKMVAAGEGGRICIVNATNLDTGAVRVFRLVPEARRAVETGDMNRLHTILLASSGIPGAFPYREIDGEMYVDGAVTSNVAYGGRLDEDDSMPAIWQRLYPGVKMPKIRYWVIFNNQIHTPPAVVRARWFDIVARSIEVSARASTVTALRHLFSLAEISRLKRGADVEVRVMAIPDEWEPPVPGVFVKETMNNLADLGEKMGADPTKWLTKAPPP